MRKYLLALLASFALVVVAYVVNTGGKAAPPASRCFLVQPGSRCINTP